MNVEENTSNTTAYIRTDQSYFKPSNNLNIFEPIIEKGKEKNPQQKNVKSVRPNI